MLTGCIFMPNDGGDPPEGTSVSFDAIALPETMSCWDSGEDATLIQDAEDVAWLAEICEDQDGDPEAFFASVLEGIGEDTGLLFVSVGYGGCTSDYDIPMIARDGDTLRPWVLKDDSAYGGGPVSCPLIARMGWQLIGVEGAADASDAELTVGVWNSDLLGSPYQAHDLERPE